jgi:hypothetical protein
MHACCCLLLFELADGSALVAITVPYCRSRCGVSHRHVRRHGSGSLSMVPRWGDCLTALIACCPARASLAILGRGHACSAARADMDRTASPRAGATATRSPCQRGREQGSRTAPRGHTRLRMYAFRSSSGRGLPPSFNCCLLDQMPVILVGLERWLHSTRGYSTKFLSS